MTFNILLYGATGFSGRLIAARAQKEMSAGRPYEGCRMVLAARDGRELRKVADRYGMEFRDFALDRRHVFERRLDGIDVVLNAAGPFALTAEPLARAALRSGCHYVDINGELDVYRRLDDLAGTAYRLERKMVSGAAASAAGSDVLLDLALQELRTRPAVVDRPELGAVRIAMAQVPDFSRGSAAAALRSLREQVLVVRKAGPESARNRPQQTMVFWHEAAGRLERSFDFGDNSKFGDRSCARHSIQIASAANLVDTPTAYHTVNRHRLVSEVIESYVVTGRLGRFAYQIGATISPLLALPVARDLIEAQANWIPKTPAGQAGGVTHTIVLQVESLSRDLWINWRLRTPNVYQFTAQLAVAVACEVARSGPNNPGWITPSDALALHRSVQPDTLGTEIDLARRESLTARRNAREVALNGSSAFAGCKLEEKE